MPRRQLRAVAMQILFQWDAQGGDFEEGIGEFLAAEGLTGSNLAFTRRLIDESIKHQEQIDQYICEVSAHWDLTRITPVDRAILRLAACEICFLDDSPAKVAIDEAVELARMFGAKEAPRFVNGLLDAILKKHNNPNL